MKRLHLLSAALLLTVACAGSSTYMIKSWKNPNVSEFQFTKAAAIVVTDNMDLRREAEDQLARLIPGSAATYALVTSEELKSPAVAKKYLQAAGFDGAVVMHLVEKQDHITYVPASAFQEFDGDVYDWEEGARKVKRTAVVIETRVYSLADGLVWAGRSKTIEPKSLRQALPDIVDAAAARMKKDGMIRS